MTTLGVVVFIVSALGSISVSSVLLSRPLVALGKASYSLYLVHAVCLLAAVHLLFGSVSLWSILAVAGFWCIVTTVTFYFVLEKPSIELGRRLSAMLVTNATVRQSSIETSVPRPHLTDAVSPTQAKRSVRKL